MSDTSQMASIYRDRIIVLIALASLLLEKFFFYQTACFGYVILYWGTGGCKLHSNIGLNFQPENALETIKEVINFLALEENVNFLRNKT